MGGWGVLLVVGERWLLLLLAQVVLMMIRRKGWCKRAWGGCGLGEDGAQCISCCESVGAVNCELGGWLCFGAPRLLPP